METLITITMTEQEYAEYKKRQDALVKAVVKKEAIQEDYEKLAHMVCNALKKVLDGDKVHLGLRTATLLYDYAETLLGRYE